MVQCSALRSAKAFAEHGYCRSAILQPTRGALVLRLVQLLRDVAFHRAPPPPPSPTSNLEPAG